LELVAVFANGNDKSDTVQTFKTGTTTFISTQHLHLHKPMLYQKKY